MSLQPQAWTREQLDRVVNGDPEAVRLFIRDLGTWFRGIVREKLYRGGAAPDDEEDFLQELTIELFREDARVLREWDPGKGASLRTYLATRVEFRLTDWHRRQVKAASRTLKPEEEEGSSFLSRQHAPGGSPVEHMEAMELVQRLEARVQGEDRVILYKLILEERPAEEVATELGLTLMALYQRRKRLLERIRGEWD